MKLAPSTPRQRSHTRAEKTITNSEEQYRLLFEANPIPMWVFDRNTLRFLAVNQAAIRQYGFTTREFLAMAITDLRPEEDIPDLLKDNVKCKHGLQESGVWRHRRKNGTIIDVEVVCHSVDFHQTEAALAAAYDVTERRSSKEK